MNASSRAVEITINSEIVTWPQSLAYPSKTLMQAQPSWHMVLLGLSCARCSSSFSLVERHEGSHFQTREKIRRVATRLKRSYVSSECASKHGTGSIFLLKDHVLLFRLLSLTVRDGDSGKVSIECGPLTSAFVTGWTGLEPTAATRWVDNQGA